MRPQRPLEREKAADHARRLGTLAGPARVQLMSLFERDAASLSLHEIAAVLPDVEEGCGSQTRYRINDDYAHCLAAIAESVLGHPAPQP
jgi:hypothetical protein